MIKKDERLRTQHADNCLAAILYMHSDLLKYQAYLIQGKCDIKYFLDYIERGIELYVDGKLDKVGTLNDEPWNDFNFRNGVSSIVGTHGELLSIIIRNSNGGDTVGWAHTHNEDDEKKGKDCVVYNPRWPDEYTSQVKLLTLSKDKKSICFKSRYFKYSTDDVNRLTLVDIHNKIMYEMSYDVIKDLLNPENPRVVQRTTSNGIELNIANLKLQQDLRFHKYQLRG